MRKTEAFTLVEVLVASTILMIVLGMMLGIVDSVQKTHSKSTSQIKAFQQGRQAMDVLTTALAEATLNTYVDYVNAAGQHRFSSGVIATNFVPSYYKRTSELRFRSGNLPEVQTSTNATHSIFFQAPLGLIASTNSTNYGGLENLLNSVGFYLEFGQDTNRPDFFANLANAPALTYRYRLWQAVQTADNLTVYKYTSTNFSYTGTDWVSDVIASTNSVNKRVAAENIIALVIIPKLGKLNPGSYTDSSLAPNYLYDSTLSSSDPMINTSAQLPPVIDLTVVAVDEKSFSRFQSTSTSPRNLGLANLFQNVGDTTNYANSGFAKDLKTLGDTLIQNRISYRVFKATIPIKSAKWSVDQKN